MRPSTKPKHTGFQANRRSVARRVKTKTNKHEISAQHCMYGSKVTSTGKGSCQPFCWFRFQMITSKEFEPLSVYYQKHQTFHTLHEFNLLVWSTKAWQVIAAAPHFMVACLNAQNNNVFKLQKCQTLSRCVERCFCWNCNLALRLRGRWQQSYFYFGIQTVKYRA